MSPALRRRRTLAQGFTLLEVLITFVILAYVRGRRGADREPRRDSHRDRWIRSDDGEPSNTLPKGTSDGPDTTAGTNQICMLATAEPCLDSSIELGQPIYLDTVWNVRTQGNAPAGAIARIQATAERCHAFNN